MYPGPALNITGRQFKSLSLSEPIRRITCQLIAVHSTCIAIVVALHRCLPCWVVFVYSLGCFPIDFFLSQDLVKSHLMFAVHEEVELLKDQIKELTIKKGQLEYENRVLRASATQETLEKLHHTASSSSSTDLS